jgi:cell division protein DivIC
MSNHHNSDTKRKKMLHKINNDNIDAATKEARIMAKIRKQRKQRVLIFLGIVVLTVVAFMHKIHTQNERIAEKQIQQQQLAAEYEEIQDLQERLKLQIAKLDDDEYIAKLARKEYFLSEEGEIIFTIPEDKEEKEKNDEQD